MNYILIIFIAFLAFNAQAQGSSIYLTDKDGTQKTQFEKSDSIFIAGLCAPASGQIAKVYTTDDKTWTGGASLYDVSSGIESVDVPNNGELPRTEIWKYLHDDGAYDVLVDTNNDFKLQDFELDCVIGASGTGFKIGNPAPLPLSPPPPPATQSTTPPPPPATPPPPPPPPPSQPSKTFSLDSYVEVKSLSNIRESAGGIKIGEQIAGTVGKVAGGPVQASVGGTNYWFWNIDFKNLSIMLLL